ncbi:M28 family peptidase [uncultured Kordia sp.]|uniref:M28 family peptidase n=1 Tax=uncultured Kordia sp. TaxID=507699 RepID=UPI0026259FB4|nr:M28 family peptidase [uncultured Kordia sp.]
MKTQKKIVGAILLLCSILVCKANNPPKVTNFKATVDKSNNTLVINYDLFDKEDSEIEVMLKISDNNGNIYLIDANNSKGDIGFPVSVGKNKRITWSYDKNTFNPKTCTVKLVADDKYEIDIEQLIKEVDTTRMKRDLQYITGDRNNSNRKARRHLKRVGNYIKNTFKANELDSYFHKLKLSNDELNKIWNAKTGFDEVVEKGDKKHNIRNVVGSIQGELDEKKVFIITAHYDSYPGSPGMDDNASGVVGLLETMRILSKYKFSHTIKFIGFDKEEDGLVGSLSYVFGGGIKEDEQIGGVINYDMIGIYSTEPGSQYIPEGFDQLYPEVCETIKKNKNRGDFVINTSNENSQELSKLFVNTAHTYVKDLKIASLLAEGSGKYVPALAASDHASFWYNRNAALHIGEGGATRNPDIHTVKDGKNHLNLNYMFMSNIVKTTIATFIKLADIQHSTTVSTRVTR